MKVGVIGAGAWGTALSIVSANSGNEVTLWSYDGEYKQFEDIEILYRDDVYLLINSSLKTKKKNCSV